MITIDLITDYLAHRRKGATPRAALRKARGIKVITLGDGRRVSLAAYLAAIRAAKAGPDIQFDRGLTCWWPCSGREVMRQFRAGVMDRIFQRGTGRREGV